MILVFDSQKLSEYGVANMLSGDVIYVTDTEEAYLKTNNIEGGDPKLYRFGIQVSPTEAVTPKITFDCDYVYSLIPRQVTITLDVENVTDKTKLKDMKLSWGSSSMDIDSVPYTLLTTVSGTTEFTFSGVYDKTAFSGKKSVTETCPIYIGAVSKETTSVEDIQTAIKNSAHLISEDAPLSTIKDYAIDLTLTEGQRIAYICGDNHATIKNVKALGNDYLKVDGVTVTIGSKTGYIYLTSPLTALSVRESFDIQ